MILLKLLLLGPTSAFLGLILLAAVITALMYAIAMMGGKNP